MNKKNKEKFVNMLCDIVKIITKENIVKEIQQKTDEICKNYFPNATQTILNEVGIMSRAGYHACASFFEVKKEINSYKE